MLFYTVLASATISIIMVSVIHAQSVKVQSVMAHNVLLFAALSVEIQSVIEISALVAHLKFLHHASCNALSNYLIILLDDMVYVYILYGF